MTQHDTDLFELDIVSLAPAMSPWSQQRLAGELARLHGTMIPAALILALPLNVAPSIEATFSERHISFRNEGVEFEGSASSIASALADLVQATISPLDVFSDPGASPTSWVHLVRSGSKNVAFGTQELFGLPRIAFAPSIPSRVAYSYIEALRTKTLPPAPTTFTAAGELFVVTGAASSLAVQPPSSLPGIQEHANKKDLDELALDIAATLGLSLLDVATLPCQERDEIEADVVMRRGPVTFVVTARLGASASAAIGYRGRVAQSSAGYTESGWTVLGPASAEPGWIGVHQESRIRALIQPTAQG